MAKPLDNLVGARQLKAEPSSPAEIDALLKRAAGLLLDASNPALGPPSRFSLAYDAAFALATAALRTAGYRVDASRASRQGEVRFRPGFRSRGCPGSPGSVGVRK